MLTAAAAITAAACASWGAAIADIWVSLPGRLMLFDWRAMVALSIVAALCWLAPGLYSRERALLIRAFCDLWARLPEDERRRLVVVSAR